jgi:2'-5' RNA ligase
MSGNVFLAVDLSDEERHGLAAVLTDADLSRVVPGKRTRPENWHITLRFIGDAEEHQTDRLAERIEALLDAEPGVIHLTAIGGFPKLSKASVLFLGVEDDYDILDLVAANCEEATMEAGFEAEDRPFHPHLTVSRIRPPKDLRILESSFDEIRFPIKVAAVTMFRSESSRDGLRYRPLYRFAL